MKETQAAMERLVNGKITAAQPKTLPAQPGAPTYIKYTPSQQGPQFNSGAGQRIIKMQDMPVDPMEPPKFRHKKVHGSPGLLSLVQSPVLSRTSDLPVASAHLGLIDVLCTCHCLIPRIISVAVLFRIFKAHMLWSTV